MATEINTTNLTRRTALAGAMAALSTVPAIASVPHDDREEWLGLYRAFCQAQYVFHRLTDDINWDFDELWATPEGLAYRAAEAALADKPAESMAGIAVKLAFWVHMDGEPDEIDATMEDAENQVAVSAWRDALRLAGLPEGLGTLAYRESMNLAAGRTS